MENNVHKMESDAVQCPICKGTDILAAYTGKSIVWACCKCSHRFETELVKVAKEKA